MQAICDICKKERKNVHKSRITGKKLCHNCYANYYKLLKIGVCPECKKLKPLIHIHTETKARICHACYESIIHIGTCIFCNEEKRINSRTENGEPVCGNCYGNHFHSLKC